MVLASMPTRLCSFTHALIFRDHQADAMHTVNARNAATSQECPDGVDPVRRRHQQRQCCQADIVDHGMAGGIQQATVAVEEIHEQECLAALVAVGER